MPRGRHSAGTQSRMQAGGNRGGGKDESRASKLAYIRVFVRACVFAAPTSEALTRPSWKEQLEGSWVHKLRYLHQWQRKALFTHDRHLDAHRGAESGKSGAVEERQCFCQSATEEMSADPKWAPAVLVPLCLARRLMKAGPSPFCIYFPLPCINTLCRM